MIVVFMLNSLINAMRKNIKLEEKKIEE